MTYNAIMIMVMEGIVFSLFTAAVALILRFIHRKKLHEKQNGWIAFIFFVVYLSMLFYVTIFRGELFRNSAHSVNLVPFDKLLSVTLYQASVLGKRTAFLIFCYNVLGNILWFFPLGFYMASQKNMNWKKAILYSAGLSLSIEVMQYMFYTGISDVDDVILNALGGLLGYLSCIWIKKRW